MKTSLIRVVYPLVAFALGLLLPVLSPQPAQTRDAATDEGGAAGAGVVAKGTDGTSLVAALDLMPDTIFTAIEPDLTWIVDLEALAQVYDGALAAPALARAGSAIGATMIGQALLDTGPEAWSRKAGFSLEGVRYMAGLKRGPQAISLIGFSDEGAASAAFDALPGRGFSPAGFPGMLRNGADGATDLARRDYGDPWRGGIGRSTVITREGAALVAASSTGGLAPILGSRAKAARHPAGQIILAAFGEEEGRLIQTVLLSPYFGLSPMDPAQMLGLSIEEARERMATAAATSIPGVPLYSAAAIADFEIGGGAKTLLLLTYADCDTATRAASVMAASWQREKPDLPAGQAGIFDAGETGCAALLRLPGAGTVTNLTFEHLGHDLLMVGSFPGRIGSGPAEAE